MAKVEAAREKLEVTDYCITQPSLEQIFLRFAKDQAEEDGAPGANAS